MSGERNKVRRNEESDKRDRRFLGSIQSILDPERSRTPLNGIKSLSTKKKNEEIKLKECNTINDALESLDLTNSDIFISLADVSKYF
jgi:hypothetical protein